MSFDNDDQRGFLLSICRCSSTRKQLRNRLAPTSCLTILFFCMQCKAVLCLDSGMVPLHDNVLKKLSTRFVLLYSFVYRQAEDLINNGFPRKIVELNDLLATPLFSTKNLEEVHQDLKVPVPSPIISNR